MKMRVKLAAESFFSSTLKVNLCIFWCWKSGDKKRHATRSLSLLLLPVVCVGEALSLTSRFSLLSVACPFAIFRFLSLPAESSALIGVALMQREES